MSRNPKRPKTCHTCGRSVANSYICRRCGIELRELLVGGTGDKAQPGIVWYLQRLRETAYKQARVERGAAARASVDGYDLLGNRTAIRLIADIGVTLAQWANDLDRLVAPHVADDDGTGLVALPAAWDGVDHWRAQYLALNIPVLRHRRSDIARLHASLLDYAKKAWKIVNRPNDVCCGKCTAVLKDRDTGDEVECGTMLYAEEADANSVECFRCHAVYSVADLREELLRATRDMRFTGPELLRLMETRLNDRMPTSSFYALVNDGRLRPRGLNEHGEDTYTYDDACEARLKPKPTKRKKK